MKIKHMPEHLWEGFDFNRYYRPL